VDLLALLRTLGALGTVLGMLAGALWLVRRYDIKLPGRVAVDARRRVAVVERSAIDARRSVLLIAPEGHVVIESNIVRAPEEIAAAVEAAAAEEARTVAQDFATFQEVLGKVRERAETVAGKVKQARATRVRAKLPPPPAPKRAPAKLKVVDPKAAAHA
jgi:flagellar protein FliO/FliZ